MVSSAIAGSRVRSQPEDNGTIGGSITLRLPSSLTRFVVHSTQTKTLKYKKTKNRRPAVQ